MPPGHGVTRLQERFQPIDELRRHSCGEARFAVFPFGGTRELRKHNEGNLEFLGQGFEAARDARDLLVAVAEPPASSSERISNGW